MRKRIASLILIFALLCAAMPVWADGPEVPEEPLGFPPDLPICYSNFDMISVREMAATHQEYTTGDMIADAYLFEAKKLGVEDIDVAVVPLGTIRGSVKRGPLTVLDAFSICYADDGDYADGCPLICVYLTGKELKTLTELDASLGPEYPELKLSYSGLNMRFNTKRIPLDRVTSVGLSRGIGMVELIENDMLYKVCCNLYAARQLDRLNVLTRGFLTITPRDENGEPLENFDDCFLQTEEGATVAEWIALADYWMSFRPGDSGLPEVPLMYAEPQNRKVAYEEGGMARIDNPGRATLLAIGAGIVLIILVLLIVSLIQRAAERRMEKRRSARAKRQP